MSAASDVRSKLDIAELTTLRIENGRLRATNNSLRAEVARLDDIVLERLPYRDSYIPEQPSRAHEWSALQHYHEVPGSMPLITSNAIAIKNECPAKVRGDHHCASCVFRDPLDGVAVGKRDSA